MSNAVRTLVGDITGRILEEIEPDVGPISWRLNATGKASFVMAASADKATAANLNFGNRVFFEFDNGLPGWGGIIVPPRRWRADGKIEVSCKAGEELLARRQTAKTRTISGTIGAIYETLISEANAVAPTGIEIGSVWTGGDSHTLTYHYANLYWKITRSLTKRLSDYDFWIEPRVVSGYIKFYANFYERRGSDKPGVALLGGHNAAQITLAEQGPVVNSWDVAGEGVNWGEKLTSHAEDTASINLYGLIEDFEAHSSTSQQATLDATVANLLAASKEPKNILSLVGLDLAPATFASYVVGDVVRVRLPDYGFDGYDQNCKIKTREYNPESGLCSLVVEEQ